jgi:hypothetical protein
MTENQMQDISKEEMEDLLKSLGEIVIIRIKFLQINEKLILNDKIYNIFN